MFSTVAFTPLLGRRSLQYAMPSSRARTWCVTLFRMRRTRLPASKFLSNSSSHSSSSSSSSSSPSSVVLGILGVNTLVFGAWKFARQRAKEGKTFPYTTMMRHFTSGEPHLLAGRWWTLLSACFSHQDTSHFAINMLTFALTAPAIVPVIGAPSLLSLYIGSGLVASFTSIIWPYVVDPILHGERASLARRRYTYSQGASGSVYAILSAYTMMRPSSTVYLFFAIPVPAWACMAGIFAWEWYCANVPQPYSHTDSVGHVGGLLAGLVYARMFRYRV